MTSPTPEQAVKNGKQFAQHLFIAGQVQGVSYRYTMAHKARELEIIGWCRNLPDGRVEALIIGTTEQMQTLVHWCEQGPPHAHVESVQVTEVQLDESHLTLNPEFEIRR